MLNKWSHVSLRFFLFIYFLCLLWQQEGNFATAHLNFITYGNNMACGAKCQYCPQEEKRIPLYNNINM